tara:strand:- start:366 stop:1154 length:789 start_codon:yes stop_codon:yes gene_type:complete
MSEGQTLTYDAGTDTVTTAENLNEAEKEALEVGENLEAQEEQLLAGKYKNAEELEKAHVELQKKLGEKSEEVSEKEEPETEPTNEAPKQSDSNILDELWEEGVSSNKLTKETFEKLQKMNPVDVAKLALQQRQQLQQNAPRDFSENDVQQIQGLVGGSENYNNMMSWATQNVPEQEIKLYDAVMDSGNPLAAYFAVQSLARRYQDASGKDGQLITGKAPKTQGDVFNSQAEMIKAMEDSRYEDDPAYRQAILDKLERSNINF